MAIVVDGAGVSELIEQLGESAEGGSCVFGFGVEGCHGHESAEGEFRFGVYGVDDGPEVLGIETLFGFFAGDVYFEEDVEVCVGGLCLSGERLDESDGVDGLDDVGVWEESFDLVSLEVPDHVPARLEWSVGGSGLVPLEGFGLEGGGAVDELLYAAFTDVDDSEP